MASSVIRSLRTGSGAALERRCMLPVAAGAGDHPRADGS